MIKCESYDCALCMNSGMKYLSLHFLCLSCRLHLLQMGRCIDRLCDSDDVLCVRGSELIFAGETGCGGVMSSGLFVGYGIHW